MKQAANSFIDTAVKREISKTIPVTGHGDPWGCETSRLPNFLENFLTGGGEVVKPYAPVALYPQEDSWY
jgi:hypothetical protein